MKINGIWLSALNSTQNVNKVKPAEQAKSPGRDGLVVSDKANVFKAMLQKAQEAPSIRQEKVSEIKEQISAGNFKIDASKIARGLLLNE